MTKALDDVIKKIRRLPEDRQAYVVELLEQIVTAGSGVFTVPADHLAGVLDGLAEAECGEFATDEDMAALWKTCGL